MSYLLELEWRMPTQPTQKQSRLYWLKWIDRQYAKADPLHVKMRTELSTKEGEEDAETIDDPSHAGNFAADRLRQG